ncbi:MAG: mevalonate kinase, partial [Candidatus Bathyarchaeia archaeon]
MGEHFCVYDAPAVAMAINMHARVEVKDSSTPGIRVTSRNLGIATRYPPASSAEDAAAEPSNQTLTPVRLAAETAASSLGMRDLRLDVTVDSRIPVGVGLGSSAAVAVATLAATACFFGVNLTKQEIFKMAYASEGVVHGRPSGIDQAACTHGGVILYRMSAGARSVAAAKPLHLVVGNTGIIRSTGAVVGKLRRMYEEDESRVAPVIAAGGSIAEEAARAIHEGNLEELG